MQKEAKETLSYRQLSSKSGFPLKQHDEIGQVTPERDKIHIYIYTEF